MATKKQHVVKVTALRPEGRWRVGRYFAPNPTTISVLESELKLLEYDELLLVERIPELKTDDKPAPKPRKTSTKTKSTNS